MTAFVRTKLGLVASFTNGGAWSQREYAVLGVPVVRVTDIRGDEIYMANCKFLPFNAQLKYAKHSLRRGDLVVATVGSHPSQPNSVVGRPVIVEAHAEGALLNQNAVIVRTTSELVDQTWLGWLGRSPQFREYVISCARGSANQVRMSIGLLREMPIDVPPIELQISNAAILAAYDALIKVNRRRIAILEDTARGLFEEWFVRLRFPGYDATAFVATPEGPRPKSWRSEKLARLAQVVTGGTWGEDNFTEKSPIRVHILRGTDFASLKSGSTCRMPQRFVGQQALRLRTLENRDIIIEGSGGSKDQPVGRALYVAPGILRRFDATIAPASFCKLLRIDANIYSPEIAYWYLDAMYRNGRIEIYQKQSTGLRNLQFGILLEQECLPVPEDGIRARFEAAIRPIMELSSNLAHQNERLASSRDLLLPRLISGQLSVNGAERELAIAA